MVHRFSHLKPGVSRKTLLILSAMLWSVIGLLLLLRGVVTVTSLDESTFHKAGTVFLALVAGSLKSCFFLDRSARRSIDRILQFRDGTCMGAVYSWKTWVLVFAMMALGIVLRNSTISAIVLCFIYFTIGWALLVSSRLAWRQWYRGNKK